MTELDELAEPGLDGILRRVAVERGWQWCHVHKSPRFDGASTCAALHDAPADAGETAEPPPFGPPLRRLDRVRTVVGRLVWGPRRR